VIVAQRLRKGACNSSRGPKPPVGDAVKTAHRLLGGSGQVLVRMDSAYYGRGPVHAALAGGAAVSVTVRSILLGSAAVTTRWNVPDPYTTSVDSTQYESRTAPHTV
jgi:hypothetical protein